jgi:hypothetical protein
MLKRLMLHYWALALLFIFIFAILGMSRYAEYRKAEHQDYAQRVRPEATIRPPSADKGANVAEKPKYSPSWVETFTWPEGVTAWALLLTLFVLAWQSNTATRAARAAEASIRLQEIGMEQWVVLNNWRAEVIPNSGLLYTDGSNRNQLRVRVDIVNPSNFPLTLTKAVIVFHLPIDTPSFFEAPRDHFLPPNAPYTVDVPLTISAQFAERFNDHLAAVRIEGQFTHFGPLKREAVQDMSGALICGKSGSRFDSDMPMHPKKQGNATQTKPQNPN